MANKTQKFETQRVEEVDFSGLTQEQLIAALMSSSQQLKQESEARKGLANEVLDVKGNIRVFCRIRPFLGREKEGGQASLVKDIHDGTLTIYNPQTKRDKSYSYDSVLGMDSTQAEAFEETRPVVLQILDGFNVCVFAYGQTGSGKTFTMIGEPGNDGINGQSAQALFEAASQRSETIEDHFQMSMFEIYNEQIGDLLLQGKPAVKLDIKAASTGMVVDGLTAEEISTFEQMSSLQNKGFNARHTGKTNMNEHSSRSHCLTLINVTSRNKITGVTTWGKLYLIDLAGSERISRSGVSDEGLKEAQHINTSLSALTTCILALHKKENHIPYRNSKLTHILQDSLGGSAKTMCFVNISPSGKAEDANETESSLRFASRVRKVELGQAKKQVDNSDMVKYKRMYEEAQQELDDVTGDIEVLKSKCDELEAQNNELSEALGQTDGELSMIKMDLETKSQEAEENSFKAQATLDELTSVQQQLDERNAELEATLEAYGEAQDDFTKVKHGLESELEHAKVKLAALEATSSALSEAQSSSAELQADKAAAEMRVEQLTNDAAILSEKYKSLEAELKRTKTERDEAKTELMAVRQETSTLGEQRADLEQRLAAASERSAELEDNATKLTGQLEEAEHKVEEAEATGGTTPRHMHTTVCASGSPGESAADCGLTEEDMMQGNTMMVLLDAYTNKVEEQIDAQQKLIVMLNEDEEEDDDDEGEREEIMAQLEEQMYETEDEKSAARVKAIAYAREINLIFKRNEDEKLQMQRQYKFQFARAKAAFDVVKDKLMKNIQERASALKAVRQELETKEQALRRTQRQKQEAERGLLEMRCIFEDMKRIEHMKRGCEVLKYHQGGGAPQIRWLQLAHDEQELRWAENRKSSSFSSIPIRDISEVLIGWESEVFKKCGREMLEKPWKCVSVASEKRSFDFSLKTEDDVITWCRGLMALVCIRPGRTAPSVDSMKKRIIQLRETQ